jgi:hypothetical protein
VRKQPSLYMCLHFVTRVTHYHYLQHFNAYHHNFQSLPHKHESDGAGQMMFRHLGNASSLVQHAIPPNIRTGNRVLPTVGQKQADLVIQIAHRVDEK